MLTTALNPSTRATNDPTTPIKISVKTVFQNPIACPIRMSTMTSTMGMRAMIRKIPNILPHFEPGTFGTGTKYIFLIMRRPPAHFQQCCLGERGRLEGFRRGPLAHFALLLFQYPNRLPLFDETK